MSRAKTKICCRRQYTSVIIQITALLDTFPIWVYIFYVYSSSGTPASVARGTSIYIHKDLSTEKCAGCMWKGNYTHRGAIWCIHFIDLNGPNIGCDNHDVPCQHLMMGESPVGSRHRAEQCQNCPSYHKHLPGRRMGLVPHFLVFPAMMGGGYTPADLGDVGYCFSLYQALSSFANIIFFLEEVVSHCGYCAVYIPSGDVADHSSNKRL